MGDVEDAERTEMWIHWLLHLDFEAWITRLQTLDEGGQSWFLGPMVLVWTPHVVSLFDQLFGDFTLPQWFKQEEVLTTLQVFKLIQCEVTLLDQVKAELLLETI